MHGPKQEIYFSSQPSGAKIFIDGKDYGNTPNTVMLERKGRLKDEDREKKMYSAKIELEGYYPYEVKIMRKADGWFWGNILFGGLIGIIIDSSNGSMYQLTPDQVIAQMSKSTAMIDKNDDSIYFAVTLTPDSSWTKIGELQIMK